MFKPWYLIPAEWAHQLAPIFLPIISHFSPANHEETHWNPFFFGNVVFPNRLGLAGGVDKQGNQLLSWQRLGCGFVEVGTITPRPQGPNPGKIIERYPTQQALWNKMGFPNHGADVALEQLSKIKKEIKVPLFINIGKNRDTANENAIDDYVQVMSKLSMFADAFVVNISSPNTKGLRDLQTETWLNELFQKLNQANTFKKAILLKLSPDLTPEALKSLMLTARGAGCSGFILTNTTLSREPDSVFPPEGGVSGLPVQKLSEQALKVAVEVFGPPSPTRPLLISVGGILSARDFEKRLELGADLVQCYSALVLNGPLFIKKVANICGRKK